MEGCFNYLVGVFVCLTVMGLLLVNWLRGIVLEHVSVFPVDDKKEYVMINLWYLDVKWLSMWEIVN